MIVARDQVYAALFDLLKQTPGFSSYWRRFVPLKQLSSAQRPALMMRQVNENVTGMFGAPSKYKLLIDVLILASTPASPINSVPSSILNPLIDAIETQLQPTNDVYRLALGQSNISRVWIEGLIEIEEAISDDVSIAMIPIVVVCV